MADVLGEGIGSTLTGASADEQERRLVEEGGPPSPLLFGGVGGARHSGGADRPHLGIGSDAPDMAASLFYVQTQSEDAAMLNKIRQIRVPFTNSINGDVIRLQGSPNLTSRTGDFTLLPDRGPHREHFITQSVAGIVLHGFHTFSKALSELIPHAEPLQWQWGEGPINVVINGGYMKNAHYDRMKQELRFFKYWDSAKGRYVSTTEDPDVVRHECGHGILDAIMPNLFMGRNLHNGALHEAFGDFASIFLLLDDISVCKELLDKCKGDLHRTNFLHQMAETFGAGVGRKGGLRDADRDYTLEQVEPQVHSTSQVFTSALYDILVKFFNHNCKLNPSADRYSTLQSSANYLCQLFLGGIYLNKHKTDITFADIANSMMELVHNDDPAVELAFKRIIEFEFRRRLVFDSRFTATPEDGALKPGWFSAGCNTVSAGFDPEEHPLPTCGDDIDCGVCQGPLAAVGDPRAESAPRPIQAW